MFLFRAKYNLDRFQKQWQAWAGQRKLARIIKAIQQAGKPSLYEGLPHQMFDAQLLKSELETRTSEISYLHGFPFYKEALPFSDEDALNATHLACKVQYYRVQVHSLIDVEDKLCGGFHPDYCIEWRTPETRAFALVCFGCYEVEFLSPNDIVRCDMAHTDEWEALLLPYHKNLPLGAAQIESRKKRAAEAAARLRVSEKS